MVSPSLNVAIDPAKLVQYQLPIVGNTQQRTDKVAFLKKVIIVIFIIEI